jgi:hypothetical protein
MLQEKGFGLFKHRSYQIIRYQNIFRQKLNYATLFPGFTDIPVFFRTLTKSYFFPYIILIMLPVLVYLHTYLSTVTYVEVLRGHSLDHCEESMYASSWSPPSMHPSCCPWPLMTGMLQKSPILVFIEKTGL